jgi:hypothetical protein
MLTADILYRVRGGVAANPASRSRATVWRAGFIAATVVSVGLAAWAGHPAGYLEADPALAHLLRGMAVIKSLLVLAAAVAVLWRYGWPISAAAAIAYAGGLCVLAAATVLIWQLTWIAPAALAFHGALIGMLYLGWRETRPAPKTKASPSAG